MFTYLVVMMNHITTRNTTKVCFSFYLKPDLVKTSLIPP